MRSAIAYLRVSTKDQGESGFGSDAQLVEIKAFAKLRGLRPTKIFQETAKAMGTQDIGDRPELDDARALAFRRSCPIIVASFDRLSRNKESTIDWTIDGDVKFISARDGENVTDASILSLAKRHQFEGEEISRRTKAALRPKKLAGELGNKTNFPFARHKGSVVNAKIAKQRLSEFAEALIRVDPHRELTAKEVAVALNAIGFKPAMSAKWTPVNVRRMISKLKAFEAHEARVLAILATSPPMFGADFAFTDDGARRWEKARDQKKSEITGKGIAIDTFKKLDSLSARSTFTESQRQWIEDWVARQEASNS
jgi:DNA invertase Pin-like site-specific DNA recombinase